MIYDVAVLQYLCNNSSEGDRKRVEEHLNQKAKDGWELDQLVIQSYNRLLVVMKKPGSGTAFPVR